MDRSFHAVRTYTRPNGARTPPAAIPEPRKLHPWYCRWEQVPARVERILAPSYEEAAEQAAMVFMDGDTFSRDRGMIIQVQPMAGIGAKTKRTVRVFVEFRPVALAKSQLVRHLEGSPELAEEDPED